jgi:U3 small nucleolar RNA-associated protein 4
MPRSNQPTTPEKIISPPARRTRSARKRRQTDAEKVAIQEKDVSTPQLTENDAAETATPRVTRRVQEEKESRIPLPPPPSTPLPPLPPSGRSTRSTRSTRKKPQSLAEKSEVESQVAATTGETPKATGSTRKKRQAASSQKKVHGVEEQSKDKNEVAASPSKKNSVRVQTPKKNVEPEPETKVEEKAAPRKNETPKVTGSTRKKRQAASSQKKVPGVEEQSKDKNEIPASSSKKKKRNSGTPKKSVEPEPETKVEEKATPSKNETPKVTGSTRKRRQAASSQKEVHGVEEQSKDKNEIPASSSKKKKRNSGTPKKSVEPEPETKVEKKATPVKNGTPKVTGSTRKRRQAASSQKEVNGVEEQSKDKNEVAASPSKKKKKNSARVQTPKKSVEPETKVEKKATPVKNQMEVQVHRLRNINYIPKGILRLCSTPYSPEANHYPQVAVSREGGSVELVSVNEKWKCVGIVEGMKNRSVDAMAWVCGAAKSDDQSQPMITEEDGPKSSIEAYFCKEHQQAAEAQEKRRLFGASRDGTIFEIDFKTKKLSGVIGSGGGAVFCLSSLCPCCTGTSESCGKLVAAGCEDGSIRIYKAADSTQYVSGEPCLELVSTLPSVGGAVISIAWLPGSGPSGMAGSVIYAGAADGTIRKFECISTLQMARMTGNAPHAISTGAVLNNDDVEMATDDQLSSLRWKAGLRMTVENRGRRSATKIWALKALRDGTVVSGDSMGNVQFWDGNAGTLLQSFEHNQNNGDVLDVAISYDQNKVMASGVDSKVVCIERVPSSSSSESRWVLTNQQRSHTHDVNSLAMVYLTDPTGNLASSGNSRELLCTGGVDTKVCSYFVANMKKYRAKTAYKYPTRAPISISKGPRILSIMRSDKVDFYQLATLKMLKDANMGTMPQDEERAYLGSVSITSSCNLVSMDVSDDGKFLAVSHTAGLMLFSLDIVDTTDDEGGKSSKVIFPTQISVPRDADVPCSALKFGPDYLICGATKGPINIIRFQNESEITSASLEHTFGQSSTETYASESFPIVQIAISADSRWFGVARNATGKGSLQVFSLSTKKHWWTLPCTEAPQSSMNFFGGDGNIDPALAVACNNGVVYLFDVENRRLSDWSQDLGFPAGPNLPRELLSTSDCPESLSYNKATPSKFVVVSWKLQ